MIRPLAGIVACFLIPALGVPADWPQWRGPDRDGVVRGVRVPRKWPRTLKEEWKVSVGPGVASPVVVGGKVYVFTREKDNELVRCLDLETGKEKWHSRPYAAPYKVGPGEGTGDDRPRSTPAVAGGRVYTLGMSGVLSCLDARTGKVLWRKEHKALPYGGASPLLADGLCIVHVGDGKTGGLTAFDARTGVVKWRSKDGSRPASGSPILVTLAGQRQVVGVSSLGLLGVSAATGKKLWEVPPGSGSNVTPVRYKDLLIFSAGDQMEPLRAIRLEKGARGITAREVWRAKGHPLYYSTPVLSGDLLFGMSVRKQGHFFCLDARTGKSLWEGPARMGLKERREAHASLLSAGSILLFLTDGGRLLVVKPSARAYEVIAKYRVADGHTAGHPVFLGDRILIKDRTTLRCLRIEAKGKE
jgi:outer membrane protein assembly factor BamB